MDLPSKPVEAFSELPITVTPFRERALAEQRWKEQLLLRTTPRPNTTSRSTDILDSKIINDPNEVKSYLRDLSSLLVSQQRKNLLEALTEQVEQLQEREDERSEEAEHEQSTSELKRGNSVEKDKLFSLPQEQLLSQTIFGKMHGGVSKIRKIDPIVIKDTSTILPVDITGSEKFNSNDEVHEFTQGDVNQEDHLDQDNVFPLIGSNNMVQTDETKKNMISMDNKSFEFQSPLFPEIVPENESESTFDSGSEDNDDYDDELDLIPISQLKTLNRQFLRENDIALAKESWKTLQNASEILFRRFAQGLTDEGRIIPDRQNILKMFEQYNITPKPSTNDDLFELCSEYLPLEHLNALEMSLFL